ncbi:ADP-ribosyltransferase [Grimontia sp. NTOU-MAR1]|uniref:ADP-ribosyltransferase n=1 Tax=Grimontia sp. NTOU-MAR1 TaxID=3111011 RepID=UPI002DC05688|nr:ADP-ribosyltransferase [Grimontia sp. NTOU-MAR1]WRV98525.1 ADP-ribosyltransferase [Grimontia sp. NTOU-MAR1]
MTRRALATLLTIVVQSHVFAEDFAEFKGRDLSPVQQEQMADDLMDWSIVHHAKAERKMVPEEYSAIERYGRVDHDVVNEYMRAGEPNEFLMPGYAEALKTRVSHMRSVMNKLPNFKGTVYRGSSIKNSLLEKLNVGDILHEKAFLSTSTIPSVAKNFSATGVYQNLSAAQFKIDLKSSGRAINAYTFKAYEAEILAKPNTYFRVEAIERISAEQNYIKLREIKNPSKYLKAEPDINIYDSFSGDEVSLRTRSALYCL